MRMFLARVYPSVLKGNPSMTALFLGASSSFKYKTLATWPMVDLDKLLSPQSSFKTFANLNASPGIALSQVWVV